MMHHTCPGLHPRRLALLMRAAIERCLLDLTGKVVLTEAASGAYVVTPVLAALAGAEYVYALTHTTRYGTVEEITAQTLDLAEIAGVQRRIEVVTQKSRTLVEQADIITNSGHVRPIDGEMIGWMKPGAAIPLMYEAWEFRPGDIDLDACIRRNIPVAGTNECHPAVDVFSFLGIMALKLLVDAGVAVYGSHILLLCDNLFSPFIERGLSRAGAHVRVSADLAAVAGDCAYDAVLVALQPQWSPVLTGTDARLIAEHMPGAVVAQFWGDIDRAALRAAGVPIWPLEEPPAGHMGILPSAVGPEPVVRLQAGGLKVGGVLSNGHALAAESDLAFVQLM